MIRAFIVDDERLAIQRLERLLRDSGRVTVVGTALDPEDAIAHLNGDRRDGVDVLFLDIQMPGVTGFELLERLDSPPATVFATAFDAYALNAFETAAVDYILKPVEQERLDRALDKVERYRAQSSQPDVKALARELAAQLSPSRKLDRIASKALKPEQVAEAGLNESDPRCAEALRMFCAVLGTAAANLVVTLGARGGVYIGGGIVPRLGEYFLRSPFRARFESKGRFSSYVSQVPAWIILAENPALRGLASALESGPASTQSAS